MKKYHYKRHQQCTKEANRLRLSLIFQAWKARPHLPVNPISSARAWLKFCHRSAAFHFAWFERFARQVTAGVRLDDKNYFTQLAYQ